MGTIVMADGMSVKELKALIQKAGLSHADCPEKPDLIARAKEAQARLDEAGGGQAQPEAPKQGSVQLAGYDCLRLGATEVPDLLVVILHGYGATNNDFADVPTMMGSLMPPGAKVAYLLPQAPRGAGGMAEWWTINPMEFVMAMQTGSDALAKILRQVPPGLPECRERLSQLLDEACALTGVTHDRIMLAGFSQGAITAMDVALHLPAEKALAGVTMLSGAPSVIEEWAARLKVHRGIKVLVTHGQADMVLPFQGSVWLRDLLQTNGAKVTYETHSGGHDLGGPAIVKKISEHWTNALPASK